MWSRPRRPRKVIFRQTENISNTIVIKYNNKKYQTVGTVPRSNRKLVETNPNPILLSHIEMTSHFQSLDNWRVWRYQRGNQNPYIEEEQTTQWLSEQVQKDKQRSTKHTYKTKDRVTRTPLKPGGELRCSGRVSSSCSTSGARRINLVTNLVISHEWEKDRIDEIFIYELKR
jgi:hypothetical protein